MTDKTRDRLIWGFTLVPIIVAWAVFFLDPSWKAGVSAIVFSVSTPILRFLLEGRRKAPLLELRKAHHKAQKANKRGLAAFLVSLNEEDLESFRALLSLLRAAEAFCQENVAIAVSRRATKGGTTKGFSVVLDGKDSYFPEWRRLAEHFPLHTKNPKLQEVLEEAFPASVKEKVFRSLKDEGLGTSPSPHPMMWSIDSNLFMTKSQVQDLLSVEDQLN